MKYFMLALCFCFGLFGVTATFAGPGDDPIFPWPTGIERKELLAEDLNGDWLAYSDLGAETFYIHFEIETTSPYRVSVLVKPTNLVNDSKTRVGLGYWGHHLYWGHISMDGERYTRMVVYREQGVLKMRIEKPFKQGYFDMHLERWPWGKPL